MKKLIAVLLTAVLLSGCSSGSFKEPVTFYYCRQNYEFHTEEPVIVPEIREALGHANDLSYLLGMYLIGPMDENLSSPFPYGTKLISTTWDGSNLTIELTDTVRSMSDIRFSLACACISQTCFQLINAESVIIVCGQRSLTTSPADLLLTDSSTTQANKGEQT